MAPWSRKGRRMKPSVAPTRRMIAISRLRCSTAMRIVVPMMMMAPIANATPTTFRSEGPPDEAVGRTDEAHDRDLAAPLQHGHADRRADDDDGHDRERHADHDADRGGESAQAVELLHPVAPEAHVVHE